MSCIFCSIANKEIPSSTIYEDDKVIAILDLSQANQGHTLVMPKKHYSDVLETDNDIWQHLMGVVQKLSIAINKAFNPDGINIINNCKEAAGQSVFHTHVHIIPRFKDDSIKLELTNNQGKYDLEEIKNKIVNCL